MPRATAVWTVWHLQIHAIVAFTLGLMLHITSFACCAPSHAHALEIADLLADAPSIILRPSRNRQDHYGSCHRTATLRVRSDPHTPCRLRLCSTRRWYSASEVHIKARASFSVKMSRKGTLQCHLASNALENTMLTAGRAHNAQARAIQDASDGAECF